MLDPEYTQEGRKMTQEEIDKFKMEKEADEDVGSLQAGAISPEQFVDNILTRGSGDDKVKLTPKRREGAITAIKSWVRKLQNKEPGMTAEYFHDNVYKAAVKALTEPAGMSEEEKAREEARRAAHKATLERVTGKKAA